LGQAFPPGDVTWRYGPAGSAAAEIGTAASDVSQQQQFAGHFPLSAIAVQRAEAVPASSDALRKSARVMQEYRR
jgi:hypothetical protein